MKEYGLGQGTLNTVIVATATVHAKMGYMICDHKLNAYIKKNI